MSQIEDHDDAQKRGDVHEKVMKFVHQHQDTTWDVLASEANVKFGTEYSAKTIADAYMEFLFLS